MTIAKLQAEVQVNLRIVATDPSSSLSASNLTVVLDDFVVAGVSVDLTTLNGTDVTNLKAAIKSAYDHLKSIT